MVVVVKRGVGSLITNDKKFLLESNPLISLVPPVECSDINNYRLLPHGPKTWYHGIKCNTYLKTVLYSCLRENKV